MDEEMVRANGEDYAPTKRLVDKAAEKIKTVPEDTRGLIEELVEEIEFLFFVINAYGEDEGYTPWRATRENYNGARKAGA